MVSCAWVELLFPPQKPQILRGELIQSASTARNGEWPLACNYSVVLRGLSAFRVNQVLSPDLK